MDITRSVISQRDRALVGGDHANYHSQTTRRIHTIRKRLGIATPRGRKYTPKASVTAENVAKNKEWVQLLLTNSERAWASAMAMKSAQSPENTQKPIAGSTKRQIASRLNRAVKHTENLVTVLEDKSTTHSTSQDVLETKAYLAMMKGSLAFEKKQWKKCLQDYSLARIIYISLGTTTKDDVFKDLLSNVVDPSIRYAAYQSKLPRTKPIPEIAIESFPASEAGSRTAIKEIDPKAFDTTAESDTGGAEGIKDLPSTISWRSRKVKIEDAAISNALGNAMARESEISSKSEAFQKGEVDAKTFATAYDNIIDARQDAVDATRQAIDELRSEGADPGDSRLQSLQVTRTAVNYAVIEWRIGRNRILCGLADGLYFEKERSRNAVKEIKHGQPKPAKEENSGKKLSRLRERVALYEAILQNLDAIGELPGVAADTEFVEEISSKIDYFRALKCLAIGRSFSINEKDANSLALYSRALALIQASGEIISKTSSESCTASDPPKLNISQSQVQTLTTHLSQLTTQYRGLVELHNISSQPKAKAEYKAPLVERLFQFEDDVDLTNLITYPPKLQPIPVKPLFFDLAWNYIEYPGRTTAAQEGVNGKTPARVGQASTEEKKEQKKGWFGFGR